MSAVTDINLYDLLKKFPVYRGGAAEGLIAKLVVAGPGADAWRLGLSDEEQRILGHVLTTEPESPGVEEVRSAVACLGKRRLGKKMEDINNALATAESQGDSQAIDDLLLMKRLAREATSRLEEF